MSVVYTWPGLWNSITALPMDETTAPRGLTYHHPPFADEETEARSWVPAHGELGPLLCRSFCKYYGYTSCLLWRPMVASTRKESLFWRRPGRWQKLILELPRESGAAYTLEVTLLASWGRLPPRDTLITAHTGFVLGSRFLLLSLAARERVALLAAGSFPKAFPPGRLGICFQDKNGDWATKD